jgi:flap endonuclease-1
MAREAGNLEGMKKFAQGTSRITPQILEESKSLLELMGIPCVQAESEAEAQAAFMTSCGDADLVGSQDYDAFLFGAENVVRNLGSTGKRKVPGKAAYVSKTPEHISLAGSLELLEITREQLIDVAICIGTDFNEGIHRVGPKTALKLILKHGDINTLIREENKDIRACVPVEKIRDFFMDPPITTDYTLKWKKPKSEALFEFLVEERGFSEKQVTKNSEILEKISSDGCQSCLENW